jgi:hypothetical protein
LKEMDNVLKKAGVVVAAAVGLSMLAAPALIAHSFTCGANC